MACNGSSAFHHIRRNGSGSSGDADHCSGDTLGSGSGSGSKEDAAQDGGQSVNGVGSEGGGPPLPPQPPPAYASRLSSPPQPPPPPEFALPVPASAPSPFLAPAAGRPPGDGAHLQPWQAAAFPGAAWQGGYSMQVGQGRARW